jgi:hypothetical protein
MKVIRILLILGSAVFLVSCTSVLPPLVSWARFTPAADQSFQLDTNTMVYGRFENKADMGGGNRIALRLRNEDSRREYLIGLREKEPVYGIAVEPGHYRIAGFVATFVDYRTAGRRTFRDAPLFEVPPNSVVYLGDFRSLTQGRIVSQSWGIQDVTNNFVATTDEFRRRYPGLAQVPVVSALDPRSEPRTSNEAAKPGSL